MSFNLKNGSTETAFPTTSENIPSAGTKGMSLRDYFAGQALTGLAAAPHYKIENLDHIGTLAELSYDLADAMLAARTQRSADE